jgi:hypothetical protein
MVVAIVIILAIVGGYIYNKRNKKGTENIEETE